MNIFLTPYDVLRMKKALNLSSGEFLEKYTIPLYLKDQKIRVVVLKMREDEDKTCPFVTPEGCQIYEDRPWPCRMYPLGMGSPKAQGDDDFYFIAEKSFPCLGFEQDKEWTVQEWLNTQGADVYNNRSKSYKEITLHRFIQEGKGLGPSKDQMFYIACYDLDRFRRHLFESNFFHLFDIEDDVIEKTEVDAKTETVRVTLRGSHISYEAMSKMLSDHGVALRSIDEINVVRKSTVASK